MVAMTVHIHGGGPAGAAVTFNDGSQASFDLIVAADGIHSVTRKFVLEPSEVSDFDPGWGGVVLWAVARFHADWFQSHGL